MAASPSPARRRLRIKDRITPLGRVERLVVENFKSYQGYHEIGPFDKFTCIIGPNGAGKSNVMDAISFCLGIRAKHLRGDRLKDLVYRREEENVESNTRSARVTLVFRAATGELLQFGRNINMAGQGTYLFGPSGSMRSLTYDDFVKNLAEHHINVKARNFLVFQGDVMELARRQGTDLTGLLETISGSDQLKDEYTRLARELEVTQEKARMHFQHRREVENAVSLLAKQRAEVERYQELRQRRDSLLLEMALFKLFCAECEVARNREQTEEIEKQVKTHEAEWRAAKRQAEEKEVACREIQAEVTNVVSIGEALRSKLELLKPEIASCRKQVAHWTKKLQERELQIRDEEGRRGEMDANLQRAHDARVAKEQEMADLKAKPITSAVPLTPEQRAKYERALAKSDAAAAQARAQLREVEDNLGMIAREVELDQRDVADLEDRRGRGRAKAAELDAERAAVEKERQIDVSNLQQRQKQAAVVAEEVKKFNIFRDTLLEEQRTLRFQLDAAKARREKLDQVEARQRIADELRAAFPSGVLGRLSELVMPTLKKFDLALQMALGGNAEAFIVRDAHTGRECVRYLKEKRIPPETFHPADRLVEPNVGSLQPLTEGHNARRLATMCVQHNEKFLDRHAAWQADGPPLIDKTLAFLLGGIVVVDDLEEAKATAYADARERGLQPRVVTLEGEVIAPNGNMQIQAMGSLGRVEFGGAEQVAEIRSQEQKLNQVEHDLATLQIESTRRQQLEAELRAQAKEAEGLQAAQDSRLRQLRAAKETEERLCAGVVTRIGELRAKLEKAAAGRAELEASKEKLEAEASTVGRKYFDRLNQELGVADVRELVIADQKERRQLRREVERLEDEVRQLVSEERGLEQKMRGSLHLESLRKDCEQYRRDIASVEQRRHDLELREKMDEERCTAYRQKARDLSARKTTLEQEVMARGMDAKKMRSYMEDARKRLKAQQEKARVVLTIQCTVLRESLERHVEVPFLLKEEAALERMLSRPQDLDDLPYQDLEAACDAVQVDYLALPEDKRDIATKTKVYDTRGVEAEYQAKVAEVSNDLDQLSPNMRAVEECAVEEEKLREIRRQADAASLDCRRLTREFETVKTERVSKFMACFRHVESCVHPYYRELTSYDGMDGGSAYLDLDDAEEPYNGGITFTACPPGKRFFPMELLSGGEKSMASMALLFAMHSYQPPPFMILDEVDAPFDRKNTGSLVNYLKKLDFQCMVISLKDTFFSHSDSIVGIYKDKEIQSSGSISLPLRKLGAASEAPETEVPIAEVFRDVD